MTSQKPELPPRFRIGMQEAAYTLGHRGIEALYAQADRSRALQDEDLTGFHMGIVLFAETTGLALFHGPILPSQGQPDSVTKVLTSS